VSGVGVRPADLGELSDAFGLAKAEAVLLVGSRIDGTDYAGSDLDLLGIYSDGGLPQTVTHPGAVRITTSVGDNWIGTRAAEEINVETVHVDTVSRLAGLLACPLDRSRSVALQPYEARLLYRLRTGRVLTGVPYMAALRARLRLDRLPPACFVTNYAIAASNLGHAEIRLRQGDVAGFAPVMAAVGHALAAAGAALYDVVIPAMKKDGPVLRKLAAEHPDLPVTLDDVVSTIAGTDNEERVTHARTALRRLRHAVTVRAETDRGWRDVARALTNEP